MSATEDRSGRAWIAAVALLFAIVAALATADLLSDVGEGTGVLHALLEGAVVLFGLSGAVTMVLRLRTVGRRAQDLEDQAQVLTERLEVSRAEAARWRKDAGDLIAGLGAAIDRQLERWGLSPAEKDVALLLLKGLSHKEIADIRDVGETTVRQQARALYKKAGLGGRHELAAFFLEDLLGPQSPRPDVATTAD